jgi:hypothetical protein
MEQPDVLILIQSDEKEGVDPYNLTSSEFPQSDWRMPGDLEPINEGSIYVLIMGMQEANFLKDSTYDEPDLC